MSFIFCNVGQCGNQLGYSLLNSVHEHLNVDTAGDDLESFFRESSTRQNSDRLVARAVCIDTEPKVVNECLWRSRREADWSLEAGNVVYRHGGAGNNWAMGYQMCSGDFLEASLNCIRRELESCHLPPLLVTIHSVAGGTGSGLGTHITEAVCDEYPDVTRLNIAITPYHFGEVVVQHYNTVLSLSKISSTSHAVLTFENEVAQELCKAMRKIERPSIADMNKTIAANIVPILLPKRIGKDGGKPSTLHDDVATLCAHPSYRFLDVKMTPQTSDESVDFTYDSWSSLMSTLERMHDRGTALERRLGGGDGGEGGAREAYVRSIGSHLMLHGPDSHEMAMQDSFGRSVPVLDSRAKISSSPSFMQPPRYFANPNYSTLLGGGTVQVHHSQHIVNGYQRSASLLSNGQAILPILQRAASKGAELYRVGAYLHQYTNCGLETEDFLASFRTIGGVIEAYNTI